MSPAVSRIRHGTSWCQGTFVLYLKFRWTWAPAFLWRLSDGHNSGPDGVPLGPGLQHPGGLPVCVAVNGKETRHVGWGAAHAEQDPPAAESSAGPWAAHPLPSLARPPGVREARLRHLAMAGRKDGRGQGCPDRQTEGLPWLLVGHAVSCDGRGYRAHPAAPSREPQATSCPWPLQPATSCLQTRASAPWAS